MTLVEQIFDALAKVQDPELRKPITDLGMVEDLQEKMVPCHSRSYLRFLLARCKIACAMMLQLRSPT